MFYLLKSLVNKVMAKKPVQQPGKRGGKFYITREGRKVRYGNRPGFFVDKKQNLRFGNTEKLTTEEHNQKRREGMSTRHEVSGIGEKIKKQSIKTIQQNIESGAKNFQTVHIAYTAKDGDVKLVHNAEPKSYRGSGKSTLFYFVNPNGLDPSTNTRGRVLRSFLLHNILAVLPGSKNYQNDPKYPVEIGQDVKKAIMKRRADGMFRLLFSKGVRKSNQGKLVYSTNFNSIIGMAKQRGMGIRDVLKKVGSRTHKDRRDFVMRVGRAFGLTDRDAVKVGKKVGTINK